MQRLYFTEYDSFMIRIMEWNVYATAAHKLST